MPSLSLVRKMTKTGTHKVQVQQLETKTPARLQTHIHKIQFGRNSTNQNVAPTKLEKCEIIQKGSNIIRQHHIRNYDRHKKRTINQNVAPTTLEECEIIQGQNLTKAILVERKQYELRYCCSFCVFILSFYFSLLLKKKKN